MLEGHLGELLGDLDRRVHVAEGGGEHQLAAGCGELADHALRIRAFGHVFNDLGDDLAAQRLLHLLAALVMLEGPAGVTDRADIDEADLQWFLRRRRQARRQRAGGGGHCRQAQGTVRAARTGRWSRRNSRGHAGRSGRRVLYSHCTHCRFS
jgi:hypothetical protein